MEEPGDELMNRSMSGQMPISEMNRKMKHGTFRFAVISMLTMLGLSALCLATSCSPETIKPANSPGEGTSISGVISEKGGYEDAAGNDQIADAPDAMGLAYEHVKTAVADYGDSVAVTVLPLDGSEGFSINGDKQFVSASMIKLLILAEYMQAVDSGQIDPTDVYVLDSKDVVGGTGAMQNEGEGTSYTYEDLARYMIMYSDNTATNILIDRLGMEVINDKADSLQLAGTSLQRKMMVLDTGMENYITADDAAAILADIANHTLASEELCVAAESFLLEQTDAEGLAQGLPTGIEIGHKTGTLDSVRHDGGIVYADDPYVIVVLTDIGTSSANNLMKEVSGIVYDSLK